MLPFSCDSWRRRARHRREALTLLELVVALGIVAVLATMAVQSLDPLADQARYDQTRLLLSRLRIATFGDPTARYSDGQLIVSGYVADTGSLPGDIADLFTLPVGIAVHATYSFDSDRDSVDDVSLGGGWRGPYVQLGAGESSVLDGWGRTPLVDPDGGEFDYRSLGSDGDSVAPEDSYRADLIEEVPSTEFSADVVFRLFAIDGTTGGRVDPSPAGLEQLGVLLYAANAAGGTTGAVEEIMLPVAASGDFEASQTSFVQRPAAARGVLWSDTDGDDQLDVGETVILSSYVHYFSVVGGVDRRLEMELRSP